MRSCLGLSVLMFTSFFCYELSAQAGHYWTRQYGTKSSLLNGSVIGGADDLGAVFYNPGRLGQLEDLSFLLSTDVYEWNRFVVTDGFGESEGIARAEISAIPSMVAGSFKIGGVFKNHRFAYAIYPRQNADFDINYSYDVIGDVIDAYPGEENFDGSINMVQSVKEQWSTFSWSYPITDKFSVGLTSVLIDYVQKRRNIIELQAFSESKETALYRFDRSYSIKKYGLLWKAGVAYKLTPFLFGLTVTTPMVGLGFREEAKYQHREFFSGISSSDDINEPDDVYTVNSQKGISVAYKRPWSVGLGMSVPIKKTIFHLSGEWYSSVPSYRMMKTDNYLRQSNGETLGFELRDDLNSVLNVGFGVEMNYFEKLSFYAGFNTDFSAVEENTIGFASNKDVAANSVISANYYHYSFGFVLALKGVDLTLGGSHAGASQKIARPINFPDGDDEPIFSEDETGTLAWDRWQIILSIDLPILRDYRDKLEDKIMNRKKKED